MNVLILSHIFPSDSDPTRGIFNLRRFEALSSHCNVKILVPVPWWNGMRKNNTHISGKSSVPPGLDVEYHTYFSVPKLTSIHGKAMYLSLKPKVESIRKTFNFDLIFSAWAYPDACAAAHLARHFECPLVTQVMGSDINELTNQRGLCRQIEWTLNQSQRVIAVSNALHDRVIDMGISPEKVVVQHNGVDGRLFQIRPRSEARSRLGIPLDRKLIVYIGNIRPVKGTDVLVEAMGFIAGKRPDADLLIVGSGELEESLRSRVQTLGLDNRVRFCGRHGHEAIPDWMCASDVFCLPSRNEGCPNVILEALASGRPVVASNVGGIPEILQECSGILVEAENPEELAMGLQEALERRWDPQVLRGSVKSLSWHEVASVYHQIICEAYVTHHDSDSIKGQVMVKD